MMIVTSSSEAGRVEQAFKYQRASEPMSFESPFPNKMIPSPFTLTLVWLSTSFLAVAVLMRPACFDTLEEGSEHFTSDPSKTWLTLDSRAPLGNEHLSQKRRHDSLDLHAFTDDGNSQHPMIDYMILDDLEMQAHLRKFFDYSPYSCDEYEWFLETGDLWDSPSQTPYHSKRPRLDASGGWVVGSEEAAENPTGFGSTEKDLDAKPMTSSTTALRSQTKFADTAAEKRHHNRDHFQEDNQNPEHANETPRKVKLGYPDAMDLTSNEIPPLTKNTVPLKSPSQNQSTEDHASKEIGRDFNYPSAKEEPVEWEYLKADDTSDQGMFLGNLPTKHVPQKIKEELIQELKQQTKNMKFTGQHPQQKDYHYEQRPPGEFKMSEISSSSEHSSQHHTRIQQDTGATATDLDSKTKDDKVIKSSISTGPRFTERKMKYRVSEKARTKSMVWPPLTEQNSGSANIGRDNKRKKIEEETPQETSSSISKSLWLEKPSDDLAKEIKIIKVTLYEKKYTNRYGEIFKEKFENLRSVITSNEVDGQPAKRGNLFSNSISSNLPKKALHRLMLDSKNDKISQDVLWKLLDNIIGKTFYILKAMTSELRETEKERSKTIDDFYRWFFSSVFDKSDSNPLTNMLVKFIDPKTQREKGFIDSIYWIGIWCRNNHPSKWRVITGNQDPHQFWINMKKILIRFENNYQFQKNPNTKDKIESQYSGKNYFITALDIPEELINGMESIAKLENTRQSLRLYRGYDLNKMNRIYQGHGNMEQAARRAPKNENHPFIFSVKRVPEERRFRYYGGLFLQYEPVSNTYQELMRKFDMIFLPSQLYFLIPEFWPSNKSENEMKEINKQFTSFVKKLLFGGGTNLQAFPIFINSYNKMNPPNMSSYSNIQRVLIQSMTQPRDRKDLLDVGIQMLSFWFTTEGKPYSDGTFTCQQDFLNHMNRVLKEKLASSSEAGRVEQTFKYQRVPGPMSLESPSPNEMIPSPFTLILVWLSASFVAVAIPTRPECFNALKEGSEHFTSDPSKTLLTLDSWAPLGNERLSQKRRYDSLDVHAFTDDGNSQHPMIDYMILDDLEMQAHLHKIFDYSPTSCDEYEWFLETGGLWDSPSQRPYHSKRPRLDASGGGFENGDNLKGFGSVEKDLDAKLMTSSTTALRSQTKFADTEAEKRHHNRDHFQEDYQNPEHSNETPRKVKLGYPDAMDLTSNEIPPLTSDTVPLKFPSQNQSTEDHDSKEIGRNFNDPIAKEEPVKLESFKADDTSDQGMFLENLPGKHVPQKNNEALIQETKQQTKNMKGTDQHAQEQRNSNGKKPLGESEVPRIKDQIPSSSGHSSRHHSRTQQDPGATATELDSETQDDKGIKSPILIGHSSTTSKIKYDVSEKPRTKSMVWPPSERDLGSTSAGKDNKRKQIKEEALGENSLGIPKFLWLEKPSGDLAKEIGSIKVTLYGNKYTNRYAEIFKEKFESLRPVISPNEIDGQFTRSGSVFSNSISSSLPKKAPHRLLLDFKNDKISQDTLWKSVDNIIGKTFYTLKAMTSELQETEEERSKTIDAFYSWFFSAVFDISDSNPLTNNLVKFIDPKTQHDKGLIDSIYLTGIWCRNNHPSKWRSIAGNQDPHQFWITMKNTLIRFENDYQFQKTQDKNNKKDDIRAPGQNHSLSALDIPEELINQMYNIAKLENTRQSLRLFKCLETKKMIRMYQGHGNMEQVAKSTPKNENHPFIFFGKYVPEERRTKNYGGIFLQYEPVSNTYEELKKKIDMIFLPSQLYFTIPEFWKSNKSQSEMAEINRDFISFFKKILYGGGKNLKAFPIFINSYNKIDPPRMSSYSNIQRVIIQSLTQPRNRKDLLDVGIQMLLFWFSTEGKPYSNDLFQCQQDFLNDMNRVLKEKNQQIHLMINSKATLRPPQH
ncbi:hypothetical protein PSHT_08015 [Puccinia striiformis]|uniref:Uncharacterized protein n=1 Tax=Puccinia striiformis TaxID=27350 RepID=A0A2S4VT82_9BASI|nr:hypothetical protein PSHT_08015 [Puccinia striiformis]